MRIYKITKGQLISIWVFGVIAFFMAIAEADSYDPSGWATVFLILIPAVLVFYTIGWRSHKKTFKSISNQEGVEESGKGFCTHCGKKSPETGRFCVSCGKELYV